MLPTMHSRGLQVVCDLPACMLTWFRSTWYNRAVVLPCYVSLFDELQREKERHRLVMDSDDRGEQRKQ
jgi:hypothetical protein